MINLPYEKIVEKIKENSSLSEEEISTRIDQKLKQLSGLISKEGAAHILANELGIKLFELSKKNLKIKDVLEGMRDIELAGKVQQIYDVREFNSERGPGKVGSFVIADETGSIRITCWHSQTETIPKLVTDLTIKIIGGYVRANNGKTEVHLNDKSKVLFNPKDVTIGEVKSFSAARKKLVELTEEDSNVEVLATIVQVFDPRFFEVCPECRKRARPREDAYFCEEHGKVSPNYSYVMNVLLDDGTETTRTTFFSSQMERLLNKTKEQVLLFRENAEAFEDLKLELLGKTIKVIGKVRRNEMFDRLELNANLVFPNVDPAEEIKKFSALKVDGKTEPAQLNTQSKPAEKPPESVEVKQQADEEEIKDIAFNKN
ncbi:MAG: DUF2240 family protein [Nanoarchaeota archaeon]|nr:DUF2240 family protein [Nanoarchaeota archaeon]